MAFDSVTAEGLTKLYGRHRALSGVDLTLRAGELCALLGPNGAGKSTLVGILSTLVRPTNGAVRYGVAGNGAGGNGAGGNGAALDGRQVRAAIGVLAHESLVYGDLTGIENLLFYATLYDVPDAPARAAALLDEVGLDATARTRSARTYSRGMLQRLALARALLHRPRLLLLDEPFTGLDREGAAALARTLATAKADGRIVLVVTHDLEAIGGLCDHLAILRRGKIALDERRPEPFTYAELKDRLA